MQAVLLWRDMAQVADKMDEAVFRYVEAHQAESFEAFDTFDLLAFDWYDVRKAGKSGKVLVYIDREDLFFFCRNEAAQQYVQGAVDTLTAGGPLNDQQLLYRFFAGLFKGDMAYLEKLEAQINGGESTILEGKAKDDAPRRIAAWRRELLHLKRYYEQLDAIFDEMCDNDNGLIEANILARLEVLGRRTGRYLQKVCALQELVAQLREQFPAIATILLNVNAKNTNVILGSETHTLYGQGYIEDTLCGVPVQLGPLSFYQVNTLAAEQLYGIAAEYAQLTPDDLLLDLYCGMGTIGLSMADHCRELVGVEIVPEAIESAKANAARMGAAVSAKSRFFCADAGQAAAQLAAEGLHPDVVMLDPPRKGCDEATLSAVVQMSPRRVVYVSCNPSTAARDAKWLETQGYRTEKVQPVDLFPRTKHVEAIVSLRREI